MDMGKQRMLALTFKTGDNVGHVQFPAMVKTDGRPYIEAPVTIRSLLPVMGDIGFDFPLFLIYTGQAAKDLAGNMGFGTAQWRSGQQIEQRTVVKDAQNMFALAKTAPQVRANHLPDLVFIPHQLD